MKMSFFIRISLMFSLLLFSGIGTASYASGLKETPLVQAEGDRNWQHSFDISNKKPGTYNIIAKGTDAAGNEQIAGPINIRVDPKSDLPIAVISNPIASMRIGGDLNIVGTCVDDDATERVELSIDGGDWIPANGTDFWSYYVPAGTIPDGNRKIKARGVDINGLIGPEYSVRFDMDKNKPLATVSSHSPGVLVAGKIELKGKVSDANRVAKLEYSLDGGEKYLPTKGSEDKKKSSRSFAAAIDTRLLPDGPLSILLRAVDGVGSVGITPFLLVIDNTKPVIQLVSPLSTDTVDSTFTLFGMASDEVGLASLQWSIGKLGADIPLTPGDPYWMLPISLMEAKGKNVEILLSAKDTIGNKTELKIRLSLDLDKDLPRTSLMQPINEAKTAGSFLLLASAQDDDGIQAMEYWLDKDKPTRVDVTGSLAVQIDGLSPGKHLVSVRAIDIYGRVGPSSTVSIVDTGSPPALFLKELVYAAGSKEEEIIPFVPGMEFSPDRRAALRFIASGGAKLSAFSWKLSGGELKSQSGKGSGEQSFLIPLSESGPYGFISIDAGLSDQEGREEKIQTYIYATDLSKVRGEPSFDFQDERLENDTFRFKTPLEAEGRPLLGRFIGAKLEKIELDPPSASFSVSFEGSQVRLDALSDAVSGPHVIVGTTDKGHQFRSQPLQLISDLSGPVLQLNSQTSGFVGNSYELSGSISDPTGLASAQYRIIDSSGNELQTGEIQVSEIDGSFALQLDLQAAPDGPLQISLLAQDSASNPTTVELDLFKDSSGPLISFITMDGGSYMPLVAGTLRDLGGVASLAFAEDGVNFQDIEEREAFILRLSRGISDSARIKALDRAGNETVLAIPGAGLPLPEGTIPGSDLAVPSDKAKLGPSVQILQMQETIDSTAILLFRISAPRAISALSWSLGSKKGNLEPGSLLPLDSASSLEVGGTFISAVIVEGYQSKSGPLTAQVSVKDAAGKTASALSKLNYDAASALPSLSLRSPEENALLSSGFSLSLSSLSPYGIASYKINLDGKALPLVESVGGLHLPLEGLSAGKHLVTVSALDTSGRESLPLKRTYTVVGAAPRLKVNNLVRKDGKEAYSSGAALVLGQGASLEGTVVAANGLSSLELYIDNRPASKLSYKKEGATNFSFNAALPELAYGRVSLRLVAGDAEAKQTELSSFFFKVAQPPANSASSTEGFYVYDDRVEQDIGGNISVKLFSEEPLNLRFEGRPLASVVFEGDSNLLELSHEGNLIRIKGREEGISASLSLKAVDVDGDEYSWGPFTPIVDRSDPVLSIQEPLDDSWVRDGVMVSGSASDPTSIEKTEWSLDGLSWTAFELKEVASLLPVPAMEGSVLLHFKAQDFSGRSTVIRRVINVDSLPPAGTLVLPRQGDLGNGRMSIASQWSDGGRLASVEFSQDGGLSWESSTSPSVMAKQVDLAPLSDTSLLRFRATDAAGNVGELPVQFALDAESDKPRVSVQLPAEDEILRANFIVSGSLFDDDGVSAIHYRYDEGDWLRLDVSGNSFELPVLLADSTDNEHSIEVYAEDMYGVVGDSTLRKYKISKEEPKASISAPSLETTVRGIVDISGVSQDANAIEDIELSFDNAVSFNAAIGAEDWTYRFDTRNLKDGLHSLYVRPTDKYGTEGFFASLISIDNTAPLVSLDLPLDGSVVADKIILSGRIYDSRGIEACEAVVFSRNDAIDEKLFILSTDPVVSEALDLSSLPDGEYGLRLSARDKSGNETMASRDFVLRAAWRDERISIASPVRGERLSGMLRIQGSLYAAAMPSSVSVFVDGQDIVSAVPDKNGWYSVDLDAKSLGEGRRLIETRFITSDDRSVSSEKVEIEFISSGPAIVATAINSGSYLAPRPWLKGKVRWMVSDADSALEASAFENADKKLASQARKLADEKKKGRVVDFVEVSLDNGRTFQKAKGKDKWQYRLETQDYSEGILPLVLRAHFKNGEMAVSKLLLNLDKTAPLVNILKPEEDGRFNGKIDVYGTASDEIELVSVQVALRDGDKAGYQLPSFIQGLYVEGGAFGDTLYNVGAGLTFFDNNVKLQAGYGSTPEDYNGIRQRFYGDVFSAKLLANVATFPFAYAFGPDWNFLQANLAVGAKFSYFSQTSSGNPLMLSAVVSQLEFPKITLDKLTVFKAYSFYTELQAWFISAEIDGGIALRMSLGARVSVF
ncbi:hypothetical protein MASR2M78_17360 [Treponema sp.]